MSLFEDGRYRWRETYFILFSSKHRPTASQMQEALQQLGSRYETANVQQNQEGLFESLTLRSPYDYSAMDISYLEGEDVTAQIEELVQDFRNDGQVDLGAGGPLDKLAQCDARFDIYHFEEISDDDEEYLDPGALLLVLEKLAGVCHGIGIDPQSGSIV